MLNATTALRDEVATSGSVRSAVDGGFFYFFSGAVPTLAAEGASDGQTLLLKVSEDGLGVDGLEFEALPTSGYLPKKGDQVWKGLVLASGTPTFAIYCADIGDDPTTEDDAVPRMLFTAGGPGNMIEFQNLPFVENGSNEVGLDAFGLYVGQ